MWERIVTNTETRQKKSGRDVRDKTKETGELRGRRAGLGGDWIPADLTCRGKGPMCR